jgi:uncharacterized protein YggE
MISATIDVAEEFSGEVPASGAKLHVSIHGSRLFTGKAAFTEAAEVRKLVDALASTGVGAKEVELKNVHVDVSKGVFTTSSSATYDVRIKCSDPARLPSLLDAVAQQKHCVLQTIEWGFDGATALRAEWLALCAERAKAKATAIAAAVGLELAGVERISEDTPERIVHERVAPGGMGMMRARSSATVSSELGGLELAPSKPMTVRLRASFRVK